MAVTIANKTNRAVTFGLSSDSFSHTSSGTAPHLIAVVGYTTGAASIEVSGATWNGVNLTRRGSRVQIEEAGVFVNSEIWELDAPAAGTFTFAISWTDAVLEGIVVVYTLADTDSTTPLGTVVTASGTDTTPTVDVTSQTDGLVLDIISRVHDGDTLSVGASQTSQYNPGTIEGFGLSASSSEPGAASVTMSWSTATGSSWVIAAVPVNPLTAPPAILTINVFDSILVPDVIVLEAVQRLLISSFDAVSIQEFVSVGRTIGISRFDTVTVADIGTIDLSSRQLTVFDSVGVSEAVFLSSIAPLQPSVFDNVGVNVGAAKVSWIANTEPDLAGYKVYYGTSSGVYTTVIDVGLTATPSTPNYTVYNLTKGITYYFNVTAYDFSNNESAFGTEVSKFIRGPVGNWYQVSVLLPSISPVDTVTVTDVGTVSVPPKPKPFDIISTAEFWQVFIQNVGSVGIDTVTISELVSLTLATAPTVTISVFDTVTIAESITLKRAERIVISDAITVGESHAVFIVTGPNVEDTLTVQEAITIIFPTSQVAPFDLITIQDAVTVQMDKVLLSVFDSVVTGEGHDGRFVRIGTGDGTGRVTQVGGISGISVIT